MNFTCECLGGSYSGRYCEIVSSKAKALQAVAKSFASIAIASLLGAATFIVVMDVLKYGFGMDFNDKKRKDIPKKKQRKPIKCCWQKKKTKKRRRPAPRHSVLSQKPVPKLVRPSVSVIIEGVMWKRHWPHRWHYHFHVVCAAAAIRLFPYSSPISMGRNWLFSSSSYNCANSISALIFKCLNIVSLGVYQSAFLQ